MHDQPVHHQDDALEQKVVKLALQGHLRKLARDAIRRQTTRGLPVTFKRGKKIVKRYADGREEVLQVVQPSKYKLPPGVRIIGRS